MAMGKRKQRQEALFVMAEELPKSAGHPFYHKLNELLAEAEFDHWVERRCKQYYASEEKRGQPSLPPGVYFRYFNGPLDLGQALCGVAKAIEVNARMLEHR